MASSVATETAYEVLEVGLQGPPGPQGTPGLSGSSAPMSYVAAANIGGEIAVTLNAGGYIVPVDLTDRSTGATVIGITTGAVASGATIPVQSQGIVTMIGWTWTAGLPVYVGAAGVLTQTIPTSTTWIKVAGIARSATQIVLSFQPTIFQ